MNTVAKKVNLLILLVVVLLIAGCTTNSLLIRYFYSGMDTKMSERMLAYASFSEFQRAEVEKSVDTFFRWHRGSELPKYAIYLNNIADEVSSGVVSSELIGAHFDRVRLFSREGFARSPMANATEFLAALTDQQVEEIAMHFEKQNLKSLKRMEESRKKINPQDKRLKSIVKNVRRLGVVFSQNQIELLKTGIAGLRNDPNQRFELWNLWEQELVSILRQRQQPGFATMLEQHVMQYQNQMEIHHPEVVKHNRDTTIRLLTQIIDSLDIEQRAALSAKLRQTASALRKIANT